MTTSKWTPKDLISQAGRTFVVTGANSGIGLAAARELGRAGARVVLAVRDEGRGRDAAASIPGDTEVRKLDLADLASVRAFADMDPQPHSEIVLVHCAVILSKLGTALALVKESYFSDLVACASASSPLHQPVNESFEPSEVQNVGLAP